MSLNNIVTDRAACLVRRKRRVKLLESTQSRGITVPLVRIGRLCESDTVLWEPFKSTRQFEKRRKEINGVNQIRAFAAWIRLQDLR